jgi:hypothetical protein
VTSHKPGYRYAHVVINHLPVNASDGLKKPHMGFQESKCILPFVDKSIPVIAEGGGKNGKL